MTKFITTMGAPPKPSEVPLSQILRMEFILKLSTALNSGNKLTTLSTQQYGEETNSEANMNTLLVVATAQVDVPSTDALSPQSCLPHNFQPPKFLRHK